MAIYRLIANGSFGPEEIEAMRAAYEAALIDLRLVDRDDPFTEIVASAILHITGTGERDPVVIKTRALRAIGDSASPGASGASPSSSAHASE
jgi:hypothetical protein